MSGCEKKHQTNTDTRIKVDTDSFEVFCGEIGTGKNDAMVGGMSGKTRRDHEHKTTYY